MFFLTGVFVLICLKSFCNGQYNIPSVTLEAFQPSGFRASIPADQYVELFGFHGKLNKPISQIEPGEFSGDIKTATGGYFTYYNPNLSLKVGDVINYWVFVQHRQLGYRKDAQTWTVKELRLEPGTGCETSKTRLSERTTTCAGVVVFEDNFTTLDETKWTLEQYIPSGPDYEFVIYKRDQDVTFVKDNKLCIKPKLNENEEELKNTIDLSDGCTRPDNTTACVRRVFLIQNPVVSGRITSKVEFAYGEFEVKARLPAGDWIFPEIYLEDQKSRRILIAYSRGNAVLTDKKGEDYGATLLFGGPVSNHTEPSRSSKLSSKRNNEPFNKNSHTYKLRWTPNVIELFLDGARYGTQNTEVGFTGENSTMFKLVLGIGVAGINDFKRESKSGNTPKPWMNKGRNQVKTFFTSRDDWYPTWGDETRQLQVESVKFKLVLGTGVAGISDFPNGFKSGNNLKPWTDKGRNQVKTFFTSRNEWYPTWGNETRQLQIEYVKVTAI